MRPDVPVQAPADWVVRFEGVSKRFDSAATPRATTLRALFSRPSSAARAAAERSAITALSDVTFEVRDGEALGLVGRNGAGKSTLLKVLSRVTPPSSGVVRVRGVLASLLEVGTGFHPELTGRENVFLSGAVLGLSRAEVRRRFDEIVAFAEVGRFIDEPVKHYSSGMHVRLAFAVAAHLEPDILIVDEVLAVGDAAFQKKCVARMQALREAGRTMLFVSHNMAAVEALCTRAVWLEGGAVRQVGDVNEVVPAYMASLRDLAARPLAERTDRRGEGPLRVTAARLETVDGTATDVFRSGEPWRLRLNYEAPGLAKGAQLAPASLWVTVFTPLYSIAFSLSTELPKDRPGLPWPASGELVCTVPRLPLMPGQYTFNLYAEALGKVSDWVIDAGRFTVEAGNFFGSADGRLPPATHPSLLVDHQWTIG
jgi:lipopolysaccharide transport system ATP-binding protein